MAGHGRQSFSKRQKEQRRKELHQEKIARRLQRTHERKPGEIADKLLEAVLGETPSLPDRP